MYQSSALIHKGGTENGHAEASIVHHRCEQRGGLLRNTSRQVMSRGVLVWGKGRRHATVVAIRHAVQIRQGGEVRLRMFAKKRCVAPRSGVS